MNFSTATLFLATVASAAAAKNPFVFQSKNNAKAKFNSKLLSKARRLNDADAEEEEVEVDLTGYSIKFEKCQFVKAYNDELAEDEDSATVLATQRFVIFKLCSGSCSTCNYGYGEYMVDLDEYLEAMVEYQQELQEEMCNACEENCQVEEEEEEEEAEDEEAEDEDEDNEDRRRKLVDVDCDTCADECDMYENMNDNGYYDATEFINCQMIYDPEDDATAALYAGPMCSSNGSKIKIGVFSDENCYAVEYGKSVESYLVDGDGYQMQIYEKTLKATYNDVCISCLVVEEEEENEDEDEDNEDEEEEEQEAEVMEICQNIYEEAAKCENAHGFSSGFENNADYVNQAENEDVVCDFIDSIKQGSYDSEGEISLYGANNNNVKGGTQTTGGQKFFLVAFIVGTVGLGAYAGMLHSKLTKGGGGELSSQGGAMA